MRTHPPGDFISTQTHTPLSDSRRHPLINHVSPENLFSPHGPQTGAEEETKDSMNANPWAEMLNSEGVGPDSRASWEERRSRLIQSSTPRASTRRIAPAAEPAPEEASKG